ncbi:DUF192 domain-containing protein [Salinilacihabitans rarus]|uniref:DUF192 domain-containing protein n=1 Tax=Salinilacihabitans rarus TaxID=2961596 RepID=UPI0020C859B1|nr:DUF192 domain-containing protein [Salinilacihabitans rarus]
MRSPPRLPAIVAAVVLLAAVGGCLGPALDGEGDDETDPGADESDGGDGNATATFLAAEGNATVTLEVAATLEEQREGLMFRESLPEDHGMVFVYDEADERSFWMKNTYVPLDMIFVAPNGTVLNVEHADPEPDASDGELERYHSDGDAQYVIELEQGFANETGVGPGTEVVFHDDLDEREESVGRQGAF